MGRDGVAKVPDHKTQPLPAPQRATTTPTTSPTTTPTTTTTMTTTMMTKATAVLILLVGFAHLCHAEEDHHDHAHEKCACLAKEYGVTLSCDDVKQVQTSIDFLEDAANDCNGTASDACKKEYFILQSHHDHCPHDALPESNEKAIHDFEEKYEDCFIPRQFNPDLSACPKVDCKASDSFTKAAETLAASACDTSCASDECKTAFQTILSGHDNCEEDDLPSGVEKALHDYEDACKDVLCNTRSTPYNPDEEVCGDHDDDEDHGDKDHSDEDHSDEAADAIAGTESAGNTTN